VHLQQVQHHRQAQVGVAQQRLGAGERHAGVGVTHLAEATWVSASAWKKRTCGACASPRFQSPWKWLCSSTTRVLWATVCLAQLRFSAR
jgi:hypothetical protein